MCETVETVAAPFGIRSQGGAVLRVSGCHGGGSLQKPPALMYKTLVGDYEGFARSKRECEHVLCKVDGGGQRLNPALSSPSSAGEAATHPCLDS